MVVLPLTVILLYYYYILNCYYYLTELSKKNVELLSGLKLRSKVDDFICLTKGRKHIICVRKNLKWNARD